MNTKIAWNVVLQIKNSNVVDMIVATIVMMIVASGITIEIEIGAFVICVQVPVMMKRSVCENMAFDFS
ncbi:hypothetical protein CCP2SC5_110032 [Azospirillaceae bacterium]